MTPYILLGRVKLPPDIGPSPENIYDEDRQIWIDKTSGEPLVSCMRARTHASQFGETTITETREGADTTEGTFHASAFGETILTRTYEGADQSEGGLDASRFGETTMTKSFEGTDRAVDALDFHAPHSHF